MFLDELARVLRLRIPADQKIKLVGEETEKIILAEQELERQGIIALRKRFIGIPEEGISPQLFSDVETIDLTVAHTNLEIWSKNGYGIYIIEYTGNVNAITKIRFNNVASSMYPIRLGKIKGAFSKIYLTNSAQIGKSFKFVIANSEYSEYGMFWAAKDLEDIYNELHTIEASRIEAATLGETLNVTMTNANAEYECDLPFDCKKFLIHTRDESEFRLAFVTGKVAAPTAPWFTVLANSSYGESGLALIEGKKLYFASGSAGKIAEVITWQ